MKSVVAIILTLLLTVAIGATADSIQAGNVGIRRHEGMFRRAKSNDNQSHNKWHGNNGNDNADKGEKDDGDHEGRNDKGSSSSDNDDVEHYLVVKTNEGRVRGFYNSTSQAYAWRGVPYGMDTSGENRFMPPKPAKKYKGVKDVTKQAKGCPQHGSGTSRAAISLFGLSTDIFKDENQSEDCLTMNIFVGKDNWESFRDSGSEGKKLPVWLNIYGGSFEWGASNVEMYQAYDLVSKNDIISVSINFRNWIFGFPQAPQLYPTKHTDDSDYQGANPGMLDIDLAIEWVYKNIDKFGGDPEKITIGGTSTGACAADNWAYTHYNKPSSKYVNGIILQSGSMTSLGRYFVADPGDDFTGEDSVWNIVAKYLGCGTSNSREQFKCMQHQRWEDVIHATFATNTSFLMTPDNITAYVDYGERLVQHRFVDAPMLLGNTKDEGNAWLIHNAYLTRILGPIITAEVWVCPTRVQAKHRRGYAPTWRYRFSPSFYIPDTPKKYQSLLTYHGSDTPYSFDTWQQLSYIPTEEAKKDKGPVFQNPLATDDNSVRAPVASLYSAAFVAFVSDPQKGLYNFHSGWPEYTPDQRSIGDFGYRNSPHFRLADSSEVDGFCPFTDAEIKENNEKWKATAQRYRSYLI